MDSKSCASAMPYSDDNTKRDVTDSEQINKLIGQLTSRMDGLISSTLGIHKRLFGDKELTKNDKNVEVSYSGFFGELLLNLRCLANQTDALEEIMRSMEQKLPTKTVPDEKGCRNDPFGRPS